MKLLAILVVLWAPCDTLAAADVIPQHLEAATLNTLPLSYLVQHVLRGRHTLRVERFGGPETLLLRCVSSGFHPGATRSTTTGTR